MANQFYTKALEKFLTGLLGDLTSVTVKTQLLDTGVYTYSAAHEFEDELSGEQAEATIGVTSAVGGEVDAPNTTFTLVSGDESEALAVLVDTAGAPSTDPLICYIDSFSAGMPVTPNGGDIIIAWASGIVFQINQAV